MLIDLIHLLDKSVGFHLLSHHLCIELSLDRVLSFHERLEKILGLCQLLLVVGNWLKLARFLFIWTCVINVYWTLVERGETWQLV
jgi:hypothetical protein